MRIKMIDRMYATQRVTISENLLQLLIAMLTVCFLSGCSGPIMPTQQEVSFLTIPVAIEKTDTHKVAAEISSRGGLTLVSVSNGASNPIQIESISIAGDKCTYISTKAEEIGPGFSISYKVPDIGLIGLCFNNKEQIHFIDDLYLGIDKKSGDKDIQLLLEVVWIEKKEWVGGKGYDVRRIIQNHTLNFSKF